MNILTIKRNRTFVEGALFSLFAFTNRGFSFFLLLVLANYLTPSEYGYLALFQTVVLLISYFISMQTEGYISVSFFEDSKDSFRNSISCIFTICFTVFLFLLIALNLVGNTLYHYTKISQHIVYLAITICISTVFTNLNLDYYRLKKEITKYGFLSIGNAFINFVLSILFVKYLKFGWEGRVYAQVLCALFFGIYSIFFFVKNKLIVCPSWSHCKTMLKWGIPLIPHMATGFLKQGCDRYIINACHNIGQVGLFSFALNLANIIIMIGVGFNQSNSVDIYKVLGNKDINTSEKNELLTNQRHKLLVIYLFITIIITMVLYFCLPIILPKYSDSMNYFLILSIFGYVNCLYYLYTNYLFYFKQTNIIMYLTFSSSICHLLLSLLFTPFSLYFTCIIYCISTSLMVLLVRHYALKILSKQLFKN